MRLRILAWGTGVVSILAATAVHAATIVVPAGGDLQAALDRAQPGDVITLVHRTSKRRGLERQRRVAIVQRDDPHARAADHRCAVNLTGQSRAHARLGDADQTTSRRAAASDSYPRAR
jgi:hypothetical protein